MAGLLEDPAASLRQLRRTGEGVDRLVAAWRALRADLTWQGEDRWTGRHRAMAEALSGRKAGDPGVSRVEALTRAIGRDFRLIGPGEAVGYDEVTWLAWAREQMAELIDAEVAGLLAHRATLDLEVVAKRRALAPDLALFDAPKPAQLARRYEAEAERGLYRALRELRQRARSEAGPAAAVPHSPAPAPISEPSPVELARADLLASFRGAVSAGILPAPKPEKRRPDPAKCRAMPPSRRDRTAPDGPRDASTIVVGRG